MFYWLVKIVLRPLFTLLFRPVVTGRQHIPRRGGALLASNHLSMTDSLFLPVMTRRRVSFLAKSEYFTGGGLKGRAKAAFVRGTGLIPINREDADAAAQSLDEGAESVRRGGLLGVYPEGTRSPDGRLYRGKTGTARMAIDTGVPVVPVAMVGTDRVQPIGKVLPRLTRVAMHFGPPLRPPMPAVGSAARREQARAFTEQIMAAIAQLSRQERADVDCATHKRTRRASSTAEPMSTSSELPSGP
ncbi:MAG: 1-acyl-sn-glycerol-3-phosphate acyltransferase [Frankiales bacterium]|nr:1-acyl-sn-glycerol-3-phosphate acyltransferase [Frankiales bacterium]